MRTWPGVRPAVPLHADNPSGSGCARRHAGRASTCHRWPHVAPLQPGTQAAHPPRMKHALEPTGTGIEQWEYAAKDGVQGNAICLCQIVQFTVIWINCILNYRYQNASSWHVNSATSIHMFLTPGRTKGLAMAPATMDDSRPDQPQPTSHSRYPPWPASHSATTFSTPKRRPPSPSPSMPTMPFCQRRSPSLAARCPPPSPSPRTVPRLASHIHTHHSSHTARRLHDHREQRCRGGARTERCLHR